MQGHEIENSESGCRIILTLGGASSPTYLLLVESNAVGRGQSDARSTGNFRPKHSSRLVDAQILGFRLVCSLSVSNQAVNEGRAMKDVRSKA
jgi:hypothetical protein